MTISYEELTRGGHQRRREKEWKCPKCGKKNINRPIDPLSGEVQKCSFCQTPKPMIWGVNVCENCMVSDQVYVLPSYVHKCPDCGSTDLKRFLPITDEALKEGIHPNYASLKWKCNKCGKDNPYPYANCLNCGASSDEGLNEIFADKHEISKIMRLSNWKCSYCGQTNRGIDKRCSNCGNIEKRAEDDIIRIIRSKPFLDESSKPVPSQKNHHENDQYLRQDSIHKLEILGRKKSHPSILEKSENFLVGAIAIAQKVWWAFPILFMLLFIMSNYKEEEFSISDMKYDTTYIVQKYTTTHHTGESTYPPADAYNIVESQESRYVFDLDDDDNDWGSDWDTGNDWGSDDWDTGNDWGSDWNAGNDWGSDWDTGNDWDSDWNTGNDWDSDWNTGNDWDSDWNDYGGDYFDSIIHIIRKLRNSIQTQVKKVLTRIEYYTVYEYDVDEWVYSRTISYSEGKEEIKSSDPKLNANERISSSLTNYILYLKKEESGNLYSLKIAEKEWQKYNIGDTIRVKTLFGYPQFIVTLKEY